MNAAAWGAGYILTIAILVVVGTALVLSARRRHRKVSWIAVVVVGVLVVGASGVAVFHSFVDRPVAHQQAAPSTPTASSVPAPVTQTHIKEIDPIDKDGTITSGYNVTETDVGSCSGPSVVYFHDPDAYQCSFKNTKGQTEVADPCFALLNGTSVYCIHSPWSLSGARLTLTTPVKYDQDWDRSKLGGDHSAPWALELVDPWNPGKRWHCQANGGAADEVGGNVESFWCVRPDGTGKAEALNKLLDTNLPVWKILLYDPSKRQPVQAEVAVAWE